MQRNIVRTAEAPAAIGPYSQAVVVPVGRSPEGMPIGVQVVARKFEDAAAIAVAKKLEVLLASY